MSHPKARPLWRIAPVLTVALLVGPVLFGIMWTVLPAIGLWRIGGVPALSLQPFQHLLAHPGLSTSLWMSFKTGVVSTLLAFGLVCVLVAGWQGTRVFFYLERLLSPLLSVPHGAAALGLAFLIAPSGWIVRLMSPWATGWDRPPDVLIPHDPGGWALIFGLLSKEIPFLLLMALAALPQTQAGERRMISLSLGYGRIWGWFLTTLPAFYRQMRLPVFAVLVYGMTNVDMALLLGPTRPPTLAILIVDWMSDPNLARRPQAAAAGVLQFALVLGALALWWCAERLITWIGQRVLALGYRMSGVLDDIGRWFSLAMGTFCATAILAGVLSHVIWSFAGRWRFPHILPDAFRLRTWDRYSADIADVFVFTMTLAAGVALVALVLSLLCLEAENRTGKPMNTTSLWVLYLPLLIPQVTFLPGLQIGLLQLGLGQGVWPVFISHLVFVLPYTFLALSGPYRAWDTRLGVLAASLGAYESRQFLVLRLPMLLKPILVAFAVGCAVSIAQYLPTLLTSGGRVQTLTTEALAVASGGDRRAIGVWSLTLTAAAWAPFGAALVIPALLYRNRRGLRDV